MSDMPGQVNSGDGGRRTVLRRSSQIGAVFAAAALLIAALHSNFATNLARAPGPGPLSGPDFPTHVINGRVGETLQIGALDLTIVGTNATFDSTQFAPDNLANYAVHVSARNAGTTDPATLVPGAFWLVDTSEGVHAPGLCMHCPQRFIVPTKIIPGSGTDGWIYFIVHQGQLPDYLVYAPLGGSVAAHIALR